MVSPLYAQEDSISVIIIEKNQFGQNSISGMEESIDNFKKNQSEKRILKKFKKKLLKRKLKKIISKIGKAIDQAVELNDKDKHRYVISAIEVGVAISAKAGIGPIFSIGGKSGIKLKFKR